MELDTETLLRIVAVVIAASLLFSSINYSKIVNTVMDFIPMPKPNPVPEPVCEEVTFLQIVDSWHTLRSQCEAYGLTEAVEKIDEVFPLLNDQD